VSSMNLGRVSRGALPYYYLKGRSVVLDFEKMSLPELLARAMGIGPDNEVVKELSLKYSTARDLYHASSRGVATDQRDRMPKGTAAQGCHGTGTQDCNSTKR